MSAHILSSCSKLDVPAHSCTHAGGIITMLYLYENRCRIGFNSVCSSCCVYLIEPVSGTTCVCTDNLEVNRRGKSGLPSRKDGRKTEQE